MHLLKRYYELAAEDRLAPSELIFLSTHEPCSLCLSAITWGGFDNFYYLFSHVDSRDEFGIPHDLKILKEVFDVDPGKYRRTNSFWQSQGIRDWLSLHESDLSEDTRKTLIDKIAAIRQRYASASRLYQASKSSNSIPSTKETLCRCHYRMTTSCQDSTGRRNDTTMRHRHDRSGRSRRVLQIEVSTQ